MPGGKNTSELLLELYEFPVGCDYYDHVMSVLSRHIPHSISTYAFTDVSSGTIEQGAIRQANQNYSKDDLAQVTRLLQSHPFTKYYVRNLGGPVLATLDLFSKEEWLRTETYNELHRPHGMVYDASVRFYTGALCVSFAFVDTVPLGQEYVRLLNLIAPHLGTAYRSFGLQTQGLTGQLPKYMMLLGSTGVPQVLSPDTEDLLNKYFPREKKRSGRSLPGEVRTWVQEQLSLAAKGNAPRKFAVRTDSSALVLNLVPFAGGWVLSMTEVMAPPAMDVFLEMGLTRREAEVLRWVVQGKQNEDIGNILSISRQTVRKHVENILNKLHCETRGAAAMLAMHALTERTHGISFDLGEG